MILTFLLLLHMVGGDAGQESHDSGEHESSVHVGSEVHTLTVVAAAFIPATYVTLYVFSRCHAPSVGQRSSLVYSFNDIYQIRGDYSLRSGKTRVRAVATCTT